MRVPLLTLLKTLYPDKSAQELHGFIACGEVLVDGGRVRDPKETVSGDAEIRFDIKKFVSRGGEKLDAALRAWPVPIRGKIFVDAGASTGGFTDCLLRHEASMVHTVDVGYNQLDYRLRIDTRVCVHEKTNIMEPLSLEPQPHAAVADLSFRSLLGAASRILALTSEGWMIGLIKPQFEIKTGIPQFDGVVRETDQLRAVLVETLLELRREGVYLEKLMESPLCGRKGNREFLALLRNHPVLDRIETLRSVDMVVKNANGCPSQ